MIDDKQLAEWEALAVPGDQCGHIDQCRCKAWALEAAVPALVAEVRALRAALAPCVDALSRLGAISDLSWSREYIALEQARAALEGSSK